MKDLELRAALKTLSDYCKEHKTECSDCLLQEGCNRLYLDNNIDEAARYLISLLPNKRKTKERKNNSMADGRNLKASIKVQNKDLGIMMDLIDVRDELINLKNYYEYVVKNAQTKQTSYKASYSALALAEACNVITYYLKDRDRIEEVIKKSKSIEELETEDVSN